MLGMELDRSVWQLAVRTALIDGVLARCHGSAPSASDKEEGGCRSERVGGHAITHEAKGSRSLVGHARRPLIAPARTPARSAAQRGGLDAPFPTSPPRRP